MECWISKADDACFYVSVCSFQIKKDLIPPNPILQYSSIPLLLIIENQVFNAGINQSNTALRKQATGNWELMRLINSPSGIFQAVSYFRRYGWRRDNPREGSFLTIRSGRCRDRLPGIPLRFPPSSTSSHRTIARDCTVAGP